MNDASMAAAVRRLANRGGGIVVVDGAEVLAELPLPVAGLLSDAPLEEVVAQSHAIVDAVRQLGLHARGAVPAPLVPRALGDPVAEAHRPGARRRRPLRARAAGGLVTTYGNAWIVTMDDSGHRARARLAAGRGRADRGGARRRGPGRRRGSRRRGGHARLRQHASPPLPDADARTGAAGRPLHVAEDAVPGLGAHRRRDGVRGGAMRPGRARPAPAARPSSTITTSSRAASRASSRPRSAPRRSSACASSPRAARWTSASPTAACRPTRSSRTSTRSSPTPSGCTGSPTARWCRSRSRRARRSPSRRG